MTCQPTMTTMISVVSRDAMRPPRGSGREVRRPPMNHQGAARGPGLERLL